MTTTSQNRPWVLRKAVLVYAPDLKVSCLARLRIVHDQIANQGSISLSITADIANLSSRSQVLTLNIPPERVEKCALAQKSNDDLCSSNLVSMLPAPEINVSAVSTLSLSLSRTGIVLCPSEMESLSPATPGDLNFHSFTKICQSRFLRLHFSRRQFVNKELDKLENLSRALRKRSLQTVTSFDNTRHGVVQKDWRVFNLSPDPPPYCQEPESEQLKQVDPPLYCEESVSKSEQVVGKRRRDPWSVSPNDERRKKPLLPSPELIGSPTEVNTPSTLSRSPSSIRPTYFTHTSSPGHTECERLTLLEHELRGVPDDLMRKLLIRSGHKHLLATDHDLIERRLKQYVDKTIERSLNDIVNSAVNDFRDQIYDQSKMNEAEFREQVDDGNSEVRNTADECLNEMKEQAQRYMHEIEEQAQQYMNYLEDHGKRRSTSSPSHELGTNARRSSI